MSNEEIKQLIKVALDASLSRQIEPVIVSNLVFKLREACPLVDAEWYTQNIENERCIHCGREIGRNEVIVWHLNELVCIACIYVNNFRTYLIRRDISFDATKLSEEVVIATEVQEPAIPPWFILMNGNCYFCDTETLTVECKHK